MLPDQQQQDADWRTREQAETDWEHGQRPEDRSISERLQNGLVLLDKPDGPTSNQVSVWTRDILDRDKAGHSGTLDPNVTGVLPVGLNRGTKILGPLSDANKEYICVMHLDAERSIDRITDTAEQFVGTIEQTPPEKSAVKQEARERDIYYLDVLEVDGSQVLFRLGCEKGFYVRTFCEQFGAALDTSGEMADLRRTQVGTFTEDDTVTLQTLVDEYTFWQNDEPHELDDILLPIEAGVRHLPKIIVKDSAVAAIAHGADLGGSGISTVQEGITPGDTTAILTLKGELVATATAKADTETMLEAADTVTDLDRVYIGKDVYPKHW